MVSKLQLGGSFFDKEKKIAKLTEENQAMKTELDNALQENKDLKTTNAQLERKVNELSNNLKLKGIEFDSLTMKQNKLKQDHENLTKKFGNLGDTNISNQDKVVTLNNEIDSLNNSIQILQNLEIRLRKEIEGLERKNVELEKKVESLNDTIEDKNKKLDIFEKSIEQKNRHISVLVKEKDRVTGGNKENSTGLGKNKDKENKEVKSFKTVEEKKKKSEFGEYGSMNEDPKATKNLIASLENEIKEKDKELEKVKKENFLLTTRLRNIKVK